MKGSRPREGSISSALRTENPREDKPPSCLGYRWLTIGLLSLGMVIIHAQRVNVALSLLAVYDNLNDKVGSDRARDSVSIPDWLVMTVTVAYWLTSFVVGQFAHLGNKTRSC